MKRMGLIFFIATITLLPLAAVVYASIPALPDGDHDTELQRLSGSGSTVWSPDGDEIIFESDRDGDWEIYKMTDDGYDVEKLTDNEADDISPAWSRDGAQIVFASDRDGDWEIYKMRDDGSFQQKLTDNEADDISPAWSPDVDEIVFASNGDGDWEIYRVRDDGWHQQKLTDNEADDISPAWSPDGWIVFTSNRDGDWEIYRMDLRGYHQEKLTDNEANDICPAWSPDGRWIVFASNKDGDWEIYKITDEGHHVEKLIDNEADDISPTWSPDGGRIAFTSNRDGDWEIYKMTDDGHDVEKLTDNEAEDMIDSKAAPPTASFISSSPRCLCTAIQFTDTTTGGSQPYSWGWDFGDGIGTSTLQNPSYHYTDAGTYDVALMVIDANGLPDAATGQVSVYPKPVAYAGPDREIHKGDSAVIGGSPTASGGTPPYIHAWRPTIGLDDPMKANPIASPFKTTAYAVEVTDANGCRATDDMVVRVSYKILLPLILKSYPTGK